MIRHLHHGHVARGAAPPRVAWLRGLRARPRHRFAVDCGFALRCSARLLTPPSPLRGYAALRGRAPPRSNGKNGGFYVLGAISACFAIFCFSDKDLKLTSPGLQAGAIFALPSRSLVTFAEKLLGDDPRRGHWCPGDFFQWARRKRSSGRPWERGKSDCRPVRGVFLFFQKTVAKGDPAAPARGGAWSRRRLLPASAGRAVGVPMNY